MRQDYQLKKGIARRPSTKLTYAVAAQVLAKVRMEPQMSCQLLRYVVARGGAFAQL